MNRVTHTRLLHDAGQPAVFKAIMQLENQLATPLLLRSTRGLTSTETEQNFYEQIAPR